jgi:hypothetical protein
MPYFPYRLVFDTETRVDATQALMFGCYRAILRGRCIEEGLFYGEDLSRKEIRALERYVVEHNRNLPRRDARRLRLYPLREFRKELFKDLYRRRCVLTGFNVPFDVARI